MAGSDLALVHLRPGPSGGLTCPVESLRLLWDLEARGFTLTRDGDALVVQPHERLTRLDYEAIRRWKAHLLALIAYSPPEVVQ